MITSRLNRADSPLVDRGTQARLVTLVLLMISSITKDRSTLLAGKLYCIIQLTGLI
jgi:hypothetical protein